MTMLIPYKIYSGTENMSLDISVLDESIKTHSSPVLRLYGWSNPTLTIGRNQDLNGINIEYCKSKNIDIVKRPTGGRAVLHDKELTYSFITHVDFLKNGQTIASSYKEISEALIIGFKQLNINLAFPEKKKVSLKNEFCMAISTGADLNYNGKKIIGSAQFRKHNYILQHGSILIDIDRYMLQNIFNSKNVDDNLVTLNEINPLITDINTLCKAVTAGFEEKFGLDFYK